MLLCAIVIRHVNWFESDVALIGYSFCAAIPTSDSDSDGDEPLNIDEMMETVAVTVLVRFSMASGIAVAIDSTIKVDEFASESVSDSNVKFCSCYYRQW